MDADEHPSVTLGPPDDPLRHRWSTALRRDAGVCGVLIRPGPIPPFPEPRWDRALVRDQVLRD